MKIKFNRCVRTASSESYILFLESENVGSLDLHFSDCVYGTVVFTKIFNSSEQKKIFEQIENEIVDSVVPREDFIFNVYQSEDIGMYADTISEEDRAYEPAKVKDFEDISKLVKSAIGKKRNIQGKLTEHIAVDFFNSLGYNAVRAGSYYDHMKIDVIAESENELILVQVKSGSISIKKIEEAVKSISEFNHSKEKTVAFLASEFPVRSEQLRKELSSRYGMSIQFYHSYQVLKSLPEYKNSF
ncbi:hypothetical protein GNP73_19660 [Aliivibrio fischeri]|uniref:restriction endonuclease n=1 Tax=Aliivibrio fischeri TaxID=668 RepID=UPI0012DA4F53|nr:restriction endonuclease [Aliivibrio fischeri]MUJ30177.1 hypothetical protein [Aliivibrio fischeri]